MRAPALIFSTRKASALIFSLRPYESSCSTIRAYKNQNFGLSKSEPEPQWHFIERIFSIWKAPALIFSTWKAPALTFSIRRAPALIFSLASNCATIRAHKNKVSVYQNRSRRLAGLEGASAVAFHRTHILDLEGTSAHILDPEGISTYILAPAVRKLLLHHSCIQKSKFRSIKIGAGAAVAFH